MQAVKVLRDTRLWGVIALAVATIVGVVAALLYVNPPGSKIVTFYTDDVSSISPGITVRIAGFTVGKIKDLSIEHHQVRVNATVDGSAFVGDQSSIQVRMLTVAGGYYVNIDSLGESPLGKHAIPKERVTLPYSLIRALTDSTRVTEGIATAPINRSINQIQQGFAGSNVETISAIVDAGTKLTDSLERQQGQVTKILDLSNEYIAHLADYRGQMRQLIEKIAILQETMVIYGKGFAATLQGLGTALSGVLDPLGQFYLHHRADFLAKFVHWQQITRSWADRTGLVLRILRRARDRMTRTLDAQDALPELLATDLCIPVVGGPC